MKFNSQESDPSAMRIEDWRRALSYDDIVGPVYNQRDDQWYIDPRSRTNRNASMSLVVGIPFEPSTGLYRIPNEIALQLGLVRAEPVATPPMTGLALREIFSSSELDFSKLTTPDSAVELVTAIAVDEGKLMNGGIGAGIRMVGYATREAVDMTFEKGLATFYSRSRDELWTKGESSGNTLTVQRVLADCDLDTVLYDVIASGPSCHTGMNSCFEIDIAEQ